jgi:hypothetical protein
MILGWSPAKVVQMFRSVAYVGHGARKEVEKCNIKKDKA